MTSKIRRNQKGLRKQRSLSHMAWRVGDEVTQDL